jgi:hypothetical protein
MGEIQQEPRSACAPPRPLLYTLLVSVALLCATPAWAAASIDGAGDAVVAVDDDDASSAQPVLTELDPATGLLCATGVDRPGMLKPARLGNAWSIDIFGSSHVELAGLCRSNR